MTNLKNTLRITESSVSVWVTGMPPVQNAGRDERMKLSRYGASDVRSTVGLNVLRAEREMQ